MTDYAVLLPGQGTQYVGMGQELYNKYKIVQDIYDRANELLDYNIRDLCFEGSKEVLANIEIAQISILLMGVCSYKVFVDKIEYRPKFICGHSLGELTALTCSGAIDLDDAIYLVKKRGELMNLASQKNKGTMAAILGVEQVVIERVCNEVTEEYKYVGIANYNTEEQIVISGYLDSVEKAVSRLKTLGGEAIYLNVTGAFHSPLMQPAVADFEKELKKYKYKQMDVCVISNYDSLPYTDANEIKIKLVKQLVNPVKWIDMMKYLQDNEIYYAVDLGPKSVVSNLVKKSGLTLKAYSYEKEKEIIFKALKKDSCYHSTIVSKCITVSICTRNIVSLNQEEYKIGVIDPYEKLCEISKKTERKERKPTTAENLAALRLLKQIFKAKKTPENEQSNRFDEIFREIGTNKDDIDYYMSHINE